MDTVTGITARRPRYGRDCRIRTPEFFEAFKELGRTMLVGMRTVEPSEVVKDEVALAVWVVASKSPEGEDVDDDGEVELGFASLEMKMGYTRVTPVGVAS
jgi:hypothetical protein